MIGPQPIQRQRVSRGNYASLAVCLFWLLVALFVLGAPDASLAQNVSATLDDGVPAGSYKQVGGTISYSTVITNSGVAAATGVTLTDPTPANTTLVAGSLHASPLAFTDDYAAVGNTKLYVGTTPSAGEPAVVLPGSLALFANDATITDTTVFVSNTAPAHGSVAVNSDGTFTYTPNAGYSGADSFTYTVANSADATLTDTGTVNITVGTRVWYVNNSGANGNGTSTSPFNSLAGAASASAANDIIYVYKGSGAYGGGLALKSGQALVSEFVALVVDSVTLRAAVPANVPTLSASSGSTVALSTGNIIDGFIITNSNGNGISGSAIGATSVADIDVTVTGGTALNATTSGTLTVTGSGNTLGSTNGTALNVANVNIGAGGLTFQSISASGGTNGIVLNTTGSSGGLTVTGDGTDTTQGGNSTGGTIQNISGADGTTQSNAASNGIGIGIYLINASNVTIQRMNIHDASNFAIDVENSSNFVMKYTTVGGSNGTNSGQQEGSVRFAELSGTNTLDNNNISGGVADNMRLDNHSASVTDLIVSNNLIHDNNASGNQGIFVDFVTGASQTLHFTGNTCTNVRANCINVTASGGAVSSSALINVVMTGNAFTGNRSTDLGGGLEIATANFDGHVRYDISNNTFLPTVGKFGVNQGGAILVDAGAASSTAVTTGLVEGRINNNTIGVSGVVKSGTQQGSGIIVGLHGSGTHTTLVTNNTVRQFGNSGMQIEAGDAGITGGTFNATVTGNSFTERANAAGGAPNGILAVIGSSSTGPNSFTANLDISGNRIVGTGNNVFLGEEDFRIRQRFDSDVFLKGYGGGSGVSDTGSVLTFLQGANNLGGTPSGTATVQNSPPHGFHSLGSVPQPIVPTLLYSPGGVEKTDTGHFALDATNVHTAAPVSPINASISSTSSSFLTQSDLDVTVSTALARWTATGLTPDQLARLCALRFEVTTLGDLHLGEADGDRIRVDSRAGGHGWFIGAADDDAEFGSRRSATRLYTDPAGAPAGRIDLLTAVMHEMGHALGLDDSYAAQDRDSLMYGFLTKGERRLPTNLDAAAAARVPGGTPHPHAHFLSSPLSIGTLPPGKSVTVKYQVTITTSTTSISNQGTVSGTNFSDVLTDDPTVGGTSNPTVTPVTIPPTSFSAQTPPAGGDVNFAYANYTFVAVGGNPAPSYALAPGSGPLPTSLILSAAGLLSGTPTATGTFSNIIVRATNFAGSFDSSPFTITINSALSFAPASLTNATAGTATNQTITVSNGTKPYTSLTVSGFSAGGTGLTSANLTTDLTAGTVTLSGTPTAAGTASFTVNVTDTAGATSTKNYTLTVVAPVPTVTSVSPASGPASGTTSVTITGTGFLNASAVTFGGTAATTFNVSNATTITATTPAHAAGAVNVVVTTPGGTGTGTNVYTYTFATTTALSAAPNPSLPGQAVTFTATVTSTGGTPTGSVDFKDGGTTLGTGTLSGGTASFSTAALALGTHSMTAVYGASGTFATSTSTTLTQEVNKSSSTTGVTSSLNPSSFGQSVAFKAKVTSSIGTATATPTGAVSFGDSVAGSLGSPVALTAVTQTGVVAGSDHSCAIGSDGSVKCWGDNNFFQLGNNNPGSPGSLIPVDVFGLGAGVTAIAAGDLHTCAVTSGGGVKCWGSNASGQLGDGSTTDSNTPVDVSGLSSGVTAVAAGSDHSCALLAAGTVQCWGFNGSGRLGNNSTTDSLVPVAVSGLSGATAITAGFAHSCAITSSAGVQCWGDNSIGQIGDGTVTRRLIPTDVSGLTSGVSRLATGLFHTCAALTAGGAKCWGNDQAGQLGDGTPSFGSPGPVVVQGLSGVLSAIGAGGYHSCAADNAGNVFCWGDNSRGELGDGTTANSAVPVAAVGFGTATALGLGASDSCAVTSAGGVRCAGANAAGNLGDGTSNDNATPVDTIGLAAATASIATSALTGGAHTITASYPGDTNNNGSLGSVGQTVNAAATTTTLSGSATPVYVGTPVTFTATVTANPPGAGNPSGSVNFSIDGGAPTTVPLQNNGGPVLTAQLTTSTLTPGVHSVNAVYIGDANFTTSTSSSLSETVDQGTTAIAVTGLAPNPSTVGQNVTITATVAVTNGAGTLSGGVTFFDGASIIGGPVVPDGSGLASITTAALGVGGHSISAAYTSDTNFAGSTSAAVTQTVNLIATATGLSSSAPNSVFGQSVTLTATVTGSPAGSVQFKDGAGSLGTATLIGGVATLTTSALAIGPHSITAAYVAAGNYAGSTSGTLTQTVSQAATKPTVQSSGSPSAFGQSVTLTATITVVDPGVGVPTGTVTFKDGATTIGTAAVAGGTASISTASLAVGSHGITAVYGGDGNFQGATTGAITQVVNQAASTIALVSAANPAAFGQSVTFTATVSVTSPGSAVPTGLVTFKDGASTLGTGALSGGVASFVTASLSVGAHTISAVYAGDANVSGSVSSNLSQTVNQSNTRTTLVSSANPGSFGQSITFTATTSAVAPGAGTPTGTVTFKDGATTLGSVSLSGGSGTFTTTALTIGAHSITALYAGSTGFATSTSAVLSETVNKAATSIAITSATPNPSFSGQSVTFAARVTATAGAGTPTGTVTFKEGATSLGTATLSGDTASYTTDSLSPGGHALTASYGGDSSFAGSTSGDLIQTVLRSCNDTFGNATLLTGATGSVVGSTVGATGESGEPNHAGNSTPLNSVWCRWTAPATGPVIMDTTGTNFDTTLAVYTGGVVSALVQVAANDNISPNTLQSRLKFNATQGTTYMFAIDGVGSATGDYVMTWSQGPSVPSLYAAVLPTSRSVVTGTIATALASVINAGGSVATQCSLALPPGFPGTFVYQATDATNAPVGTPDTPVDIPPNASQGFVFGVTPTLNLSAIDVAIVFACSNTAPAVSVPSIDTLSLSAGPVPTPDLIAISATPSNDGIVTMPVGGLGYFAAAAVNIGVAGDITATVDTDDQTLLLTVGLCRTDPATGVCINPAAPGASTTSTFATNEVATYTAFIQSSGAVPFDPAVNRLFMRFKTPDGVTRGATSVAVRTQ